MGTTKTLRLGTRRSALAWVQSSQVAAALRAAHPGLEVELVGIDTRGDRVLDKPLSQMEGKEFFTAELDAALRERRVDFTVHSLKDLALDRPADFVLAAVPKRANPRDLALFAPDVPARLAAGADLRIGTSSPRRMQLLPGFLARALPHAARGSLRLESLRGNVDTRLRRLHEPQGSERHLDGVVLAMAGLARLFADTTTERHGRELLTGLLGGLKLMVLPLTDSPGAPGQGALAIECRADDTATRALLAVLEDAPTREAVAVERALLGEHGGGCHQRFGATLSWLPELGGLLRIAGRNAAEEDITGRRFLPDVALPAIQGEVRAWDGTTASKAPATSLVDAASLAPRLRHQAVFVAHSRALPAGAAPALAAKKVWTSGPQSWFALAAQGVWVQGCGEGLGAESTAQLIAEPVLRLPPPRDWDVLTHAAAVEPWQAASWQGANVIATYKVSEGELPDAQALAAATHIFWSSTAQFEHGRHLANAAAWHASGAGKTAAHIRETAVRNFTAFPSVEEWRRWTARAH
ncbi:MAG TPA: hydroxymethylbilane synthase [Steroidobacteraceae bacterium]|nr:hydroxymethylbilane synthase [Steroidobacteraceae bacterium]